MNCLVHGEARFAFVPASAAEVIDTWQVSGLRGTGSHDYRLDDVFVPAERTTAAFVVAPVQPGALYRVPFLSLASSSLAAVCLGIARAAIDALGRAEALVRCARAGLFNAMQQTWDDAASGGPATIAARVSMRLACAFCAEACVTAVDLVVQTAGALFETGPIARCFRDVHAATQHIGLHVDNYEHAGRVLFGREPGPRY